MLGYSCFFPDPNFHKEIEDFATMLRLLCFSMAGLFGLLALVQINAYNASPNDPRLSDARIMVVGSFCLVAMAFYMYGMNQ